MKTIFINAGALLLAITIMCVTAVHGSTSMKAVTVTADEDEEITQQSEQGIAQIWAESSSISSSTDSSQQENSSSLTGEGSSVPSAVSSQSSSIQASSRPSSSSQSSSSTQSSTSSHASSQTNPDSEHEKLINIIAGAVQAEIIGRGSVPQPRYYEAYKAQAIACHSYMQYYKNRNGSYPSMSYTAPNSKTVSLVREVADKLVYYGGNVVCTFYHASSGGHTQSSQYVWGSALGHLKGVESSYDEEPSSYTISISECESKLKAKGLNTSSSPDSWFDLQSADRSDGGFVTYMNVCGVRTNMRTMRENVFGGTKLRSTKITNIKVTDTSITFYTKGYGHGVGLSQVGALGYSNSGWSYKQILNHYYTGITIK